ncbi:L-threonylcarbamoyladenylate synthase [Algisphaera agarilytica]|uniref:Threonylcarbamoyl-AMP synthase n=1 Tax=Algisphaera agarilytica TaxID=1385975 RepID=A0A7X0LKP5_9BACT|nr:L-threonylcarbamoyladenylate synthase [Algisphaera agarilytica]MBB6429856.1 L-threonylcarbamoyladenylate synthase [Algisphaera agarilytica]
MASEQEIEDAGQLLRDGGIVAMPTETVYGLAAHALDADAVAKVFAAKARPSFDPLIVHVPDADTAWSLVAIDQLHDGLHGLPEVLTQAFWPGPLTMVLPKREFIPGIVTSGLQTVGVRVPAHPVAQQLLEAAGVPLAAPSANTFGGISPTRAEHVTVECDAVLDGGPCETGVESTVVGFDADASASGVVVLRLGGTSVEAIEAVVGGAVAVAKPGEKIASPGMLDRHYAPRTPLRLVDRIEDLDPASLGNQRVGLLSLRGEQGRGMGFAAAEVLSPSADLVVAAAQLFEAMHRLDRAGLDLIVAQRVPDRGLGRAINDRLRRAATA